MSLDVHLTNLLLWKKNIAKKKPDEWKSGVLIFFRYWFDVLSHRALSRLVTTLQNAPKRAQVNDLRTTMTLMTIAVPKASSVSRKTFLETQFTTIRRTLVKVPSYNMRVSQYDSLRNSMALRENMTRARGKKLEGEEGGRQKRSARCYMTR